jgi:glutaredoxin 3
MKKNILKYDGNDLPVFKGEGETLSNKYLAIYEKQLAARWTHHTVKVDGDITDYAGSDKIVKDVIDRIFLIFTNSDLNVNQAYFILANLVNINSIQIMYSEFSAMEATHAMSYSNLVTGIGYDGDFFKRYTELDFMAAKFEHLNSLAPKQWYEYENREEFTEAVLRYIFNMSALVEGVSLFGNFSVLLFFSLGGHFSDQSQINKYSIRDENIHIEGNEAVFKDIIERDLGGNFRKEFKDLLIADTELLMKFEYELGKYIFDDGEIEIEINGELMNNELLNEQLLYLRDYRLYQFGLIDTIENKTSFIWFNEMLLADENTDFFSADLTNYTVTDSGRPDTWTMVRKNISNKVE